MAAFDPITAGLELAGKVIDRVWPDKTQQDAAKLDLLKVQIANEVSLVASQIAVNQAEASNSSLFVSGWRPGAGWICVGALAIQYLVRPILQYIGVVSGHPMPELPTLDGQLWELMLGMLGLGGLRSFDKMKGTSR